MEPVCTTVGLVDTTLRRHRPLHRQQAHTESNSQQRLGMLTCLSLQRVMAPWGASAGGDGQDGGSARLYC